MNTYWIVCAVIAVAMFIPGEYYAMAHSTRQNTLSRAIYLLGSNFPLSIWFMGVFCGGLAVHFFWHWCPAGSESLGLLGKPQGEFVLWMLL